jgi:hypothetical protein
MIPINFNQGGMMDTMDPVLREEVPEEKAAEVDLLFVAENEARGGVYVRYPDRFNYMISDIKRGEFWMWIELNVIIVGTSQMAVLTVGDMHNTEFSFRARLPIGDVDAYKLADRIEIMLSQLERMRQPSAAL